MPAKTTDLQEGGCEAKELVRAQSSTHDGLIQGSRVQLQLCSREAHLLRAALYVLHTLIADLIQWLPIHAWPMNGQEKSIMPWLRCFKIWQDMPCHWLTG